MAKKKTSKKRTGLVLGHLERISSEAFDKYREIITELAGGRNGIYALYRNNQLYYVGLATDLKRRVNRHLKDRHAGKWNYFSLYLVRSEKYLKELESLTIRIAWPKGNRIQGSFKGAADLRSSLKRKMIARAREDVIRIMGEADKKAPTRNAERAKRKQAARKAAETRQAGQNIPLKGLLKNKRLRKTYKGKDYVAWVLASGRVKLKDTGKIFDSPSGAAEAIRGRHTNGWTFWHYRNAKGEWGPLNTLRGK